MNADFSTYDLKRYVGLALLRIPGVGRLEPNWVTLAIVVPSALAGLSLANGWWIAAALGLAGRMALASLDGAIAERFGKKTRLGGYLNRLVTELGDVLVLLGLFAIADPLWVLLVVAGAWLVNVFGLLGLVSGGSLQWAGPAGQADRFAILIVASLLSLFVAVPWTLVCQILVALLAITAVIRASRSVRELSRS